MKLVGRIPVEPLDDERLTNIERRVVSGAADAAARAPTPAPSRAFGFAAAAIAVVAAGVIGWKLGTSKATAPGLAEATPIQISTDAQRSTLDIGDATIQSDPSTVFAVTRPAGGVLVEMARGKVELQVGKRHDRPPLIVRAGDTDVIVIGTHFSVDYGDGTGEVDVRCTEGVVKVVHHQQQIRVAAGTAWATTRGVIALADAGPGLRARGAPGAPGAPGSPGSPGSPNVSGSPGSPGSPTASGTSAPGTGSNDALAAAEDPGHTGSGAFEIEMGKAPDVLHDRTAQVPDGRTPPRVPAAGAGAKKPGGGSDHTAVPTHVTNDRAVDLPTLIDQQPVEPAMDVGEPQAEKAISIYRGIVLTKKGDEASRAFYSIAVLQAQKLGRTGDALQTLDAYVRRFSGGKEYTAALWLRVRVLCKRAIDERCRQAAYTYQHQAPDSPMAHIAERITISE